MSRSYFFTDTEGRILGPCPEAEIRAFYETGHIEATTEVCPEDGTDWIPLVKAMDLTSRSETQPPIAVAPETVPVPTSAPSQSEDSGGMSLRGLLIEMAERRLELALADAAPVPVAIENVGRDVVTVSLPDSGDVLHLPLTRLRSVRERADHAGACLAFD